jgi:hypothetical protein
LLLARPIAELPAPAAPAGGAIHPAAALRLGLLIEMGYPAAEARRLLRLTKTTYYRAMSQIATRW